MLKNNLPQGWVECEFDKVCNIYTGNSINEKEKAEKFTNIFDGYNYIATKDISNTHSIDYENGVKIPFGLSKYRLAPQNTSLLCIEGGSAGRKLGFTQQTVCFVNKLCAFVPYSTDINSKFIYYYLQSKKFANYFNKNKTGLIGGVSIQKLKKILICIPPLNEQKRIVEKIEEEFEKIDEGIEKLKLVQEQIKQYKQSVLKSAFEGKLYKTTEWKEKQLKQICDVRDGTHESPRYIQKGYPLITSKNLKNNKITYENVKYISEYDYNKINERSKVNIGDVLFAMIGTIGNPVVVTEEAQYAIKNVALFKPLKIINSYFLKYYLDTTSVITKMGIEAKGSTQKFVPLGYLRDFVISLPTLDEQKQIIFEIEKRFEVADNVAKIVEENLEKAEQLKQSILKKAFEGRLVPQYPTDEPASVLLERIKKERNKK